MKYSQHYNLRLPQRGGEGASDDAADINDLTYDFEILDSQLYACAQSCAQLGQDKASAQALAQHAASQQNPHGVTAAQLGLEALTSGQLEALLV